MNIGEDQGTPESAVHETLLFSIRGAWPPTIASKIFRKAYSRLLTLGEQSQRHWHRKRTEVVIPLYGRAECVLWNCQGELALQRSIEAGTCGILVPPGFAHQFACRAGPECNLLVLATSGVDDKVVVSPQSPGGDRYVARQNRKKVGP